MSKTYDVVIIGGGVSGTALLYTLNKFTDIKSVALIEKYAKPGLVNSKSSNNSQTLHSGDIETNYSFEKAKRVKRKADMLKWYLEEYKKTILQKNNSSRYTIRGFLRSEIKR